METRPAARAALVPAAEAGRLLVRPTADRACRPLQVFAADRLTPLLSRVLFEQAAVGARGDAVDAQGPACRLCRLAAVRGCHCSFGDTRRCVVVFFSILLGPSD